MALNQLLDQFLGGGQQAANPAEQASPAGQNALSGILPGGVSNQMLGGLAAGGLLGVLVGNKKMRKTATKAATGAVGVGAAAALGLVAYKAYQNWQGKGGATNGSPNPPTSPATPQPPMPAAQGSTPAPGSYTQSSPAPVPMRSWEGSVPPSGQVTEQDFDMTRQSASDGTPFQAVLIKAMISAANADGHIDAKEQFAIFDLIEKMELEPDDKALVFKTLQNPPDISAIAGAAASLEQASEIYLVSRLAIDPDHPMELAYLQDLSTQLALPPELVTQLETQLQAVDPAAA
ncbi:MAG: DUF533 domain-containing protein [Rhizobiaceae bacterium]